MKKYLLLVLLFSLTLSACGAEKSSDALMGSWKLISYGSADSPVPAVEGSEAQLSFNEDGTVAGNSGCNGFGGDYTVEGDRITFDQIVSTLMLCDEPLMEQEEAVHQVLNETVTYQIDGNTLTLTKDDRVLMFTR